MTADGSARYDVKAAKESALQGIPMSLCLFDELHIAKRGMWSAAVLGTAQRKDGMVIGITTAGDETSETLIELYKLGIQDVEYLRNKLFAALKVPKAFLGYDENIEGKATLAAEDIAARRKEFEAARDDPFKKVQYQQSLLQGLPVAAQNYSYQPPSALTELMNAAGGAQKLWDMLFGPRTTTPPG